MPRRPPHKPSPLRDHNTIEKYTYTPLSDPELDIRLLRLHPAPDASWPIRCSIFHAKRDEAPRYTALSYTWGKENKGERIVVDGVGVLIGPSLGQALLRLREGGGSIGRGSGNRKGDAVLWVDALCINQDDVKERSVQTTRMRGVYASADVVAVWLGTEYSGSSGAVSMMREINSSSSTSELEEWVSEPGNRERLEAVVQLFRRQYWWRVWVIQEIACAKKAVVYVGHEAVAWGEVNRVCDSLRSVESTLRSIFYKNPSYVRTLTHGGPRSLQLSRYNPSVTLPPLLELLLTHKSKKATDPKDKVFALVGISSSRETFGGIDYSRSVRDVYVDVVRHVIETTKRLDAICVKQHDVSQYSLPSWTPDWTRPRAAAGATVLGLHHHEPPFSAAGATDAEASFLEVEEDGAMLSILKTRGLVLSEITQLGIPYKKKGAPGDVTPALEAFHSWWDLYFSTCPDATTVLGQARFARMISCASWSFSSPESYIEKLDAIFELAEEKLADSDIIRVEVPRVGSGFLSRSGTFDGISRSDTMSSSASSLPQDEDDDYETEVREEEKARCVYFISSFQTTGQRWTIAPYCQIPKECIV